MIKKFANRPRVQGRPGDESGSLILDILIGMAIFALIAIIAISAIGQYRERAYQQSAVSDAEQVANAITANTIDPATALGGAKELRMYGEMDDTDLAAIGVTRTKGSKVYLEIWGQEYFYICVQNHTAYAYYESSNDVWKDKGYRADGTECARSFGLGPDAPYEPPPEYCVSGNATARAVCIADMMRASEHSLTYFRDDYSSLGPLLGLYSYGYAPNASYALNPNFTYRVTGDYWSNPNGDLTVDVYGDDGTQARMILDTVTEDVLLPAGQFHAGDLNDGTATAEDAGHYASLDGFWFITNKMNDYLRNNPSRNASQVPTSTFSNWSVSETTGPTGGPWTLKFTGETEPGGRYASIRDCTYTYARHDADSVKLTGASC